MDVRYTPDEEILLFADSFAKTHNQLSEGEYQSLSGKYIILLREIDPPIEPRNFAVGNKEHKMFFSKDKLNSFSENYIFYMVLWLNCHSNMFGQYENTDKLVLEYYVTTGRSKRDILVGVTEAVSQNKGDTQMNMERLKYYTQTLTSQL